MRKREWIKVLFAAISLISLIVIFCFRKKYPTIDTTFNDDDCMVLSVNGMNFVFDTGADITLLYTDTIPNSTSFFYNAIATDIYGNEIKLKKYLLLYPGLLNDGRFFQTVMILPKSFGIKNIDGILGTDIINHSNWNIDFKRQTINNQFYKSEQIPDMIFNYRKKESRWVIDLQLDSILVEDVIIDTGYTRSDFILPKGYEDKLNIEFFRKDTCYNFKNTLFKIDLYTKRECLVNNTRVKEAIISFSEGEHVIGLPFFKRFSSIYIDTHEKMISCYN
ncbi:hypothetical protein [Bacteroides sp.]|uniref:hypothetical protein n=1 Tax=Bacteroides sp. TaxID=29523 RepID=UPI0023D21F72|nr:hypothetical protein [Bacteroides sp.]MDE5711304.1 hypothetical protein [Bacteroides sp.]MDE6214906.1 hypothetical protein [Bacteroides sp.]